MVPILMEGTSGSGCQTPGPGFVQPLFRKGKGNQESLNLGLRLGMNAAAVGSRSAVCPARPRRPRVWYQARRFIPGLPEPARLQQCHHINVPTSP